MNLVTITFSPASRHFIHLMPKYFSPVSCSHILLICISLQYEKVYYVCIAVLILDAGLLARSQLPEGPATGHLDTGFSVSLCL